MSKTIRAALPGYDVLTDTNLDHFSLYGDVDNVLIKRKQTGTDTIADGGATPQTGTYPHNLGYIPFFVAYANFHNDDIWGILNNQYGSFSVPEDITAADTTNLYITNFQAQTVPVAYDIFYDDMSQTGTPSITETDKVIKVGRPGVNVLTSKNPNDYIMHSDLNNFKILGSGVTTGLSVAANGIISSTDITHGIDIQAPVKFFCFVKFPDGKTILLGSAGAYSYDKSKGTLTVRATTLAIKLYNFGAGAVTVDVAWYIYGSGKTGTINNSGDIISVAKSGSNVLTETNPDNFNFHSNYPTLKYATSGVWDMGVITDTTLKTIPHNLGYVPFHIGFVNDLQAYFSAGAYAIMPYYLADSYSGHTLHDIVSNIYADDTNIYLETYYQANAVGTSMHPIFYYKIFKNSLGL